MRPYMITVCHINIKFNDAENRAAMKITVGVKGRKDSTRHHRRCAAAGVFICYKISGKKLE